MIIHMGSNFLHNHPGKEKQLELDKDHVIVDREDWELALKILNETTENSKKRIAIMGGGYQGYICGIDEASTIFIAHDDVVKYPNLPTNVGWHEADSRDKYIIQLQEGLSQEEFIREYLGEAKVIEEFKNMSIQANISAESMKSLSESFAAYDLKNNPKQKHKGHERPYKYHR